ncbi:MAG: hypothetical protein OWQ59_00740 [Alicyclobacillaceae bacterium]|jgi:cell division protein FtsL|uniref:hypothetical protein n=1 Tax=Alicyclobacillus sp. SP_1 TaxID=2942475 RepID=UPI002157C4EB|nr:hypothetical protein [Alicyclobacillus sp. SP_1]MCY0886978.1 hypothetical protein [Alicyclobacillaceae bacterium]MCY0897186.1 hypothetical protein [Alicyclobacillaceae bacterium]
MSVARQMAVPVERPATQRQSEQGRVHRPQNAAVGMKMSRNIASMILCVSIALVAMWLISGQGAKTYSLTYANVGLQTKIAQLSADNASLRTQVDTLERPSRILALAKKYHMQYIDPLQIPASSSN